MASPPLVHHLSPSSSSCSQACRRPVWDPLERGRPELCARVPRHTTLNCAERGRSRHDVKPALRLDREAASELYIIDEVKSFSIKPCVAFWHPASFYGTWMENEKTPREGEKMCSIWTRLPKGKPGFIHMAVIDSL